MSEGNILQQARTKTEAIDIVFIAELQAVIFGQRLGHRAGPCQRQHRL